MLFTRFFTRCELWRSGDFSTTSGSDGRCPQNFFKHNTISSQSISQLASHTSTMQLQRNFQAVMRLCAHVKFLALEQIPEADRPLILVHVWALSLSTPYHSLNIPLKKYSVIVIQDSHICTNSSRTHIYSISYSISTTISYPLSSLSFSLLLPIYRRALPVACYCSIRYCSVTFTVCRCRRSNATCGVQSSLPSRGADSLTSVSEHCL
jgi:hypothetical protein